MANEVSNTGPITESATPTPAAPNSTPAPADRTARALAALEGAAPAETPAPDAAKAQPPATPPEPKPQAPNAGEDAKRFAALTKKESALRKQQAEIKAAQDQIAKDREELADFRRKQDAAKRNPEAIAKQLWGDDWYDQLTEFKINGNKATPELTAAYVDERIDALKKQTEAERKAELEQEQQRKAAASQQVIDDFRSEAVEYVKTNGNLYEMTVAFGAEQYVPAMIEENYAQTGKVMTVKEAADLVEKWLEERALATQKIKAKASPRPKGDSKRIDSAQQRQTLSNDLTASTPVSGPAKTEAERIKRATAALKALERE